MTYAQNEKLISSWDYATAKRGGAFYGSKDTYNLTVTDKRIIYGKDKKNGYDRTEILLDSVKAVDFECGNTSLLAFILIALGIAIFVFGIFLFGSHIVAQYDVFFITMTAIGIILGIKGAQLMGQKAEVKIYITCVAQPFAFANRGSGTKLKQVTKLKIKKEIFNDLKESLSTILLNVK